MTDIREIETILVHLPTRRERRWTGLAEPIGRYVEKYRVVPGEARA